MVRGAVTNWLEITTRKVADEQCAVNTRQYQLVDRVLCCKEKLGDEHERGGKFATKVSTFLGRSKFLFSLIDVRTTVSRLDRFNAISVVIGKGERCHRLPENHLSTWENARESFALRLISALIEFLHRIRLASSYLILVEFLGRKNE